MSYKGPHSLCSAPFMPLSQHCCPQAYRAPSSQAKTCPIAHESVCLLEAVFSWSQKIWIIRGTGQSAAHWVGFPFTAVGSPLKEILQGPPEQGCGPWYWHLHTQPILLLLFMAVISSTEICLFMSWAMQTVSSLVDVNPCGIGRAESDGFYSDETCSRWCPGVFAELESQPITRVLDSLSSFL